MGGGQGVWQEAPWGAALVRELTQPPASSPNWNLEQGSGDATGLTGWKWMSHEALPWPPPQLLPHPQLPQVSPPQPGLGKSQSWVVYTLEPGAPLRPAVLCT